MWSAGVVLFTMLANHPPMEIAMTSDWWFRALKVSVLCPHSQLNGTFFPIIVFTAEGRERKRDATALCT